MAILQQICVIDRTLPSDGVYVVDVDFKEAYLSDSVLFDGRTSVLKSIFCFSGDIYGHTDHSLVR